MKIALNLGSGPRLIKSTSDVRWVNIDQDRVEVPEAVEFLQTDVRNGLPFEDEDVDAVYCSHFLDHLNYYEAIAFLKEVRRVLKRDGVVWIAVEDLDGLIKTYHQGEMDKFAHQQPAIFSQVKSEALKLGMILFGALVKRRDYRGHKMIYNLQGLLETLELCALKGERTNSTFTGVEEAWPGKGHSIYVEAKK